MKQACSNKEHRKTTYREHIWTAVIQLLIQHPSLRQEKHQEENYSYNN
jgi:hypothetical protein